jgi:hypothetical protein
VYPSEEPSKAARVFTVVVKLLVVVMVLLPIAAIVQYHSASREAEREFNRQQIEHQRKMDKMIKDYNAARVRASTVANP